MAMTSATGKNRLDSGFTLIELMTVVLIIIFLAGLLLGAGTYVVKRSAIKSAEAQIIAISRALDQYSADHRSYPRPTLNVSLFPPDATTEEKNQLCPGLALSAISSQYSSGKFEYYTATINELDVNSDNVLDASDQFSGEYMLLDVWGYPLYYYTVARTINIGGITYTAYFGSVNVNGCDLGSRGPDHIPNSAGADGVWGATITGDDIANWKM